MITGQVDASESLFTYPEGLTTEDFAVLDHDPPYLDEVVANASAEVRQMCGDNVECIFDSIETGDINIGVETMTIISQIDEDEMQAGTVYTCINVNLLILYYVVILLYIFYTLMICMQRLILREVATTVSIQYKH